MDSLNRLVNEVFRHREVDGCFEFRTNFLNCPIFERDESTGYVYGGFVMDSRSQWGGPEGLGHGVEFDSEFI